MNINDELIDVADSTPLIKVSLAPSRLHYVIELLHVDVNRMRALVEHARSHGDRGSLGELGNVYNMALEVVETLVLAMTVGASFTGDDVKSEGSALVDVEELRELREFYQNGAAREAELFELRAFVMDLKTMSPLQLDDSAQQMAYELCARWGLVDAHTPK